jgi:hypothetical protein
MDDKTVAFAGVKERREYSEGGVFIAMIQHQEGMDPMTLQS